MKTKQPKFPFFVSTLPRELTTHEREVVKRLLEKAEPGYILQVEGLKVVGRCSCGQCPIVFFESHVPGVPEYDLSTYAGKDQEGGLVAAVLLQRQGRLSQLEFYSIDGHDPWYPPKAHDLEPYA